MRGDRLLELIFILIALCVVAWAAVTFVGGFLGFIVALVAVLLMLYAVVKAIQGGTFKRTL